MHGLPDFLNLLLSGMFIFLKRELGMPCGIQGSFRDVLRRLSSGSAGYYSRRSPRTVNDTRLIKSNSTRPTAERKRLRTIVSGISAFSRAIPEL